jgi:hypothetical protein
VSLEKADLGGCAGHDSTDGPSACNVEGHANFRAHVEGRVAWARHVNAAKAARLERDLARIDWSR